MAIRIKTQQSSIGEDLSSKLGVLGIEVIFEEEDNKIVNPIADIPEDEPIYKDIDEIK